MSASSSTEPLGPLQPASAPALPRLLAGVPEEGAMSLERHLAVHGEPPGVEGARRRGRARASALIEEIERSGLLGHGGAAFPTAAKMRAVAAAGRRSIVVANGAEGEPASLKDRTLLELVPHLVLDGAVLAARAVGAEEAIVCVCESAGAALEGVTVAIAERERTLGDAGVRVELAAVPGHYVAGQESALVNHLNGGPALPTFTPPLPFERGVRGRPTLVNNVETLAHLALLARHGATWFRQLGTPSQPGSALVTLSGPVGHPGVYEIEHGSPLSSLIEASGGLTSRPRAVLLGGYAGAWIGAERLGAVALSNEHLAAHGAGLGAGIVLLLSEQACPVSETARGARWLAGQSARQCGPCFHGLDALADTLEEVAGGAARGKAAQRLQRLAALTQRRGACAHPDGAVEFVLSAVEAFAAEFADHARHGACEACGRAPELPLPARPPATETQRRPLLRR